MRLVCLLLTSLVVTVFALGCGFFKVLSPTPTPALQPTPAAKLTPLGTSAIFATPSPFTISTPIPTAGLTPAPTSVLTLIPEPTPPQTPELTPTPAPTPTATPARTPTPEPTPTQATTPTPAPLYTGPLFDTHLHLNSPPVLPFFGSGSVLLRYLDRHQEKWALGFYGLLPETSGPTTSRVLPFVTDTRARIVPLLSPLPPAFASEQYTENLLRSRLHPQGPFQGIGELGLYRADMQTVTFNSPSMQTVFRVLHEMKGIVMIHPSDPFIGGRTMDMAEIEPSIRNYPDILFLFHGGPNPFNLISPLMAKYPNVYYTMDANIWLMGGPQYKLMEPEGAGTGNSQQFFDVFNQVGPERLLELSLPRFLSRIRQHPHRVMWGTDRGAAWHFEESVTNVVIGMSRQLIARLHTDIQEKYAFQNALRVFGRFLTSNP